MNTKKFSEAMSEIDDKYIVEAIQYQNKKKRNGWMKWASLAACFCIVAVTTLFAINAYAVNNNKELLEVDTAPPDGLTLAIVDAAPDDAEFLITNGTGYEVEYGRANRVEKYDGESWIEVTTESVGIFPATLETLQPDEQMYGMIGLVSKRLILEAGTYRYLLVVNVKDVDNGTYPVVLKAEFEIK